MMEKRIFTCLLLVGLLLCGIGGLIACTGEPGIPMEAPTDAETHPALSETACPTEWATVAEDTEDAALRDTTAEESIPDEAVTDRETEEETVPELLFSPTVYDVELITTSKNTTAGSFRLWQKEVENGDGPTDNAVITSPYHKLTVNGRSVPVYTARCGTGAHSFAWIDVTAEGDFALEISLTISPKITKCVILPESRSTEVTMTDHTVANVITEEGSYTYTFANAAKAEITDPTLAPLTIMVTRAPAYEIPENYTVREIQPGDHDMYALEFTEEYTAYVMKAGLHRISSIGLPSNSMLIIEQGAYIKVEDRQIDSTTYNTLTALHADGVTNVQIISRGLLDCGSLKGGSDKYKHVVNTANSRDVTIEGLTIINANTWTICAYRCSNVQITRNLLLGYRTYSDGIMMSDCIDSAGTHNFVRTGDDAIEFKATGWWGSTSVTGGNCLYEYNDVWTDKGVGYGIIYESANDMSGMVFRNNSIGFAQSAWSERNAAIDCHLGSNASATWSDITFENIQIYRVESPNVVSLRVVEAGGHLENITFRNLTVASTAPNTYALRMHYAASGGGMSGIRFYGYDFCGRRLTTADKTDTALFSNKAGTFFQAVTLE